MTEPVASSLRFERGRDGRTFVAAQRVLAPLAFTRAFHVDDAPGGLCTAILSSTNGALIPGDDLRLSIEAGPGAQVHLTTAGATAVHGGAEVRQRTSIAAGPASFVEVWPAPLLLFPDARLRTELRVDLEPAAVVVVCEAVTLAHPPQSFARLASVVEVRRAAGLVCCDRVELAGRSPAVDAPGVLGGRSRHAAVWVLGDVRVHTLAVELREQLTGCEAVDAGVGALPGDAGVVVRLAAEGAGDLGDALHAIWALARLAVFGRLPAPRRTGSLLRPAG